MSAIEPRVCRSPERARSSTRGHSEQGAGIDVGKTCPDNAVSHRVLVETQRYQRGAGPEMSEVTRILPEIEQCDSGAAADEGGRG